MFEGTAFVDLSPGSPGAPALGDRAIPLGQTSTYVSLADVMSVLRPRVQRNVRAGASGVARTLAAPTDVRLRGILRRAPGLTADVARVARAARGPHAAELRGAIAGLSRTARAVAVRSLDLPALVSGTASTARALDDAAPLDAALARLPATMARLRDGGAALDGTLRRLRPLAAELEPAVTRLKPAVDAVRPLLRSARGALARATPVVANLRTALDAARPATGSTRAVLASLREPLATLDGSLLGALEKKTSLGTPAYLSFLGLFAGGGGASAPFAAGGAGHFMRFGLRFLTGVGLPLPRCALLTQAAPQLGAALETSGGCTP
jgi:ABC-type transporter Mla subunit MlaD